MQGARAVTLITLTRMDAHRAARLSHGRRSASSIGERYS
jgi:hypothetical protein